MPVLNTDLQALLDAMYGLGLFDWRGLDAPAVRAKFAAIKVIPTLSEVARVEDIEIPGTGGVVPCRFYHPHPERRLPLLVWFHGGGWVLGDLDSEEATARRLALCGDMAVLSVDYRLAPEHRFPCAFYDAVSAWQWAVEHAQELGCMQGGCGLGGGSAGGNLAAAVALMSVADGGPVPAHQLLVYPVVDAHFDRPSMLEYAEGLVLHRAHLQWFWDQYVPAVEQRSDWRAAPLQASSHVGLPPTTIVLAAHDPLLDEGLAYANALQAAGVEVGCTVHAGLTHGFQGMAAKVPEALTIVEQMAAGVGARLRRGASRVSH